MKTELFLVMAVILASCGESLHDSKVIDSKLVGAEVGPCPTGIMKTCETQVTYVSELYPNSIVVEYLASDQGPGADKPFEVRNPTRKGFKYGDTLTVVEVWFDRDQSHVK